MENTNNQPQAANNQAQNPSATEPAAQQGAEGKMFTQADIDRISHHRLRSCEKVAA